MFFISDAWAQSADAAAGGMNGFLLQIVPIILIFIVFLVLPDPPAAEAPEGTHEDVRRACKGR